MKRLPIFLFFLHLAFLPSLHAAEIEPQRTPLRKLQRGFLNAALSPFEIAHELHKEKNKDDVVPSWAVGLGTGGLFMVGRALAGIYEMVTFPFPLPRDYAPLLEPEFPWQHFDEEAAASESSKDSITA